MKKNNHEFSISEAFDKMLHENKWENKIIIEVIASKWEFLVGPVIAEVTDSIWNKEDVLYIKIKDSRFYEEVNMQKSLIIKMVNSFAKSEIVNSIKIIYQKN